jgi:hypothetical protein
VSFGWEWKQMPGGGLVQVVLVDQIWDGHLSHGAGFKPAEIAVDVKRRG